jgi:hypothetical protein
MNSPLLFQELSLVPPSDLSNDVLYLPPGNPFRLQYLDGEELEDLFPINELEDFFPIDSSFSFPPEILLSLENFEFIVALPPGNPFSLDDFNFEIEGSFPQDGSILKELLSPETALEEGWSVFFQDGEGETALFLQRFDSLEDFSQGVFSDEDGNSSLWIILSELIESDSVINPTEASDIQSLKQIAPAVEEILSFGISWLNGEQLPGLLVVVDNLVSINSENASIFPPIT